MVKLTKMVKEVKNTEKLQTKFFVLCFQGVAIAYYFLILTTGCVTRVVQMNAEYTDGVQTFLGFLGSAHVITSHSLDN